MVGYRSGLGLGVTGYRLGLGLGLLGESLIVITSVMYVISFIVASYRFCRLPLGFRDDSGMLMISVTYLTAGVLGPPISLIIITSGPNGVPICLRTMMSMFRLVISVLGYPLLSVPGIVGRSYFLYTLKVYGRGCVIRSVFCLLWVLIGGVVCFFTYIFKYL